MRRLAAIKRCVARRPYILMPYFAFFAFFAHFASPVLNALPDACGRA